MAIKVGRWDCHQCGHKGNKGPETKCEKCGAPRPKDVKFYLPEDAEIVTNKQKIKQARTGADWVCSYCGAHNKAYNSNCHSCGNDRQATDGDKSLQQKTYKTDETPRGEEPDVEKEKKSGISAKFKRRVKRVLIGFAAFFFILIVLAMFEQKEQGQIVGHEWKRTVEIEHNANVMEEGWQLPSNAELIDTFTDIHHYDKEFDGYETRTRTVKKKVGTEKVKVGEKDLGNGYFEDVYEERPVYEKVEEEYQAKKYKKIPVYRTKFKYYVKKWKRDTPAVSSGNNHTAEWPTDPRLNDKENYRVMQKTEEYYLIIEDHNQEVQKEVVPLHFWSKYQKGDSITITASSVFGYYIRIADDYGR